MRSPRRFLSLVTVAAFAFALPTFAAESHGKDQDPNTPTAEQRAGYPLKTCLVTDDDLDEMGHPVAYTYKEYGKPDRVVLFCCKDCVADFEKEPAKYLKKLDDANAKKAAEKK